MFYPWTIISWSVEAEVMRWKADLFIGRFCSFVCDWNEQSN